MTDERKKALLAEGSRAYKRGAQEIDNPYFGREADCWELGRQEEKKKRGPDSVRGDRP